MLFEVGHNEMGDADEVEYVLPKDTSDMHKGMGFPKLDPVALTSRLAQGRLAQGTVPCVLLWHFGIVASPFWPVRRQ